MDVTNGWMDESSLRFLDQAFGRRSVTKRAKSAIRWRPVWASVSPHLVPAGDVLLIMRRYSSVVYNDEKQARLDVGVLLPPQALLKCDSASDGGNRLISGCRLQGCAKRLPRKDTFFQLNYWGFTTHNVIKIQLWRKFPHPRQGSNLRPYPYSVRQKHLERYQTRHPFTQRCT